MENEYKDYTPEELRMRDHAEYYMQLYGYIMGEKSPLQELHDELCRLLVKIAGEYPESIALNLDNVMKFPRVKVLDPEAPNYGKTVTLKFKVFVKMYEGGVDYEASTGLKGDDVFFLSLALWYEVCCLRDKLKLKGMKFRRFEKEVNAAILEARERKEQEALLMEQQRRENEIALLPHFRVQRSDDELLAILRGLKEVEWRNRNSRRIGVFADEVTEEEWLAAMRGPRDDSELKRKKIAWEAKYVCKSFVAQYLDGDYELAERVFCLAEGKELKRLCDTNISKNKEMCDEVTGKIAQIIRAAMRK